MFNVEYSSILSLLYILLECKYWLKYWLTVTDC